MRIPLADLLQRMGVTYVLGPYETCPWSATDSATGRTCSAEVRMNTEGDEIEAELQIFYDNPAPGKLSIDQVLWLKALPNQNLWEVTELRIKREDWRGRIYGWDEKCQNFFRLCVMELQKGVIPDIDDLISKEMQDSSGGGGGGGRGGGKSPKIKPAQLLQMKQSAGM